MESITSGSSGSSFWSKPEGKFGTVISIMLALGLGYGFWKILPFLVQMATNTLILGIEVTVIAGLFYVLVLDNSLRNLLSNFYKRFIQAMYILSFNVDPIGGLRVRMNERKQQLVAARSQAGLVKGQSQSVQSTIDRNDSLIEKGLKKMELARSNGDLPQATAESVIVGVAQASNKELAAVKVRIDRVYEMISDIIRKAELGVYVLDGVITVKEQTFKAAKAGRSALNSALGVLRGDTEKDEIFDANIGWIDDYTSVALGDMDAAIDLSKDALNSINLQHGVYSQDAFNLLEERLKNSQQKLLSDPRAQKLLEASTNPAALVGMSSDTVRETVPVTRSQGADFKRILDRK